MIRDSSASIDVLPRYLRFLRLYLFTRSRLPCATYKLTAFRRAPLRSGFKKFVCNNSPNVPHATPTHQLPHVQPFRLRPWLPPRCIEPEIFYDNELDLRVMQRDVTAETQPRE